MREFVPRRLLVVFDWVFVSAPPSPAPPPPLPLIFVGGGLRRDGSNSDGTLFCFLIGVRLGDDFRLFDKFFNVFALEIEIQIKEEKKSFQNQSFAFFQDYKKSMNLRIQQFQ